MDVKEAGKRGGNKTKQIPGHLKKISALGVAARKAKKITKEDPLTLY